METLHEAALHLHCQVSTNPMRIVIVALQAHIVVQVFSEYARGISFPLCLVSFLTCSFLGRA